jgi:hypothetical protein
LIELGDAMGTELKSPLGAPGDSDKLFETWVESIEGIRNEIAPMVVNFQLAMHVELSETM